MAQLDYMHKEINKICPIDGLSHDDKNGFTIHFKDEATIEQKQAAIEYMESFVWSAELEAKEAKAERDAKYKDDLGVKAGYASYKAANPNATFTGYLDYLETL